MLIAIVFGIPVLTGCSGAVDKPFQLGIDLAPSSPFPATLTFLDDHHFIFSAKGTEAFAANTKAGESARLSWLTDYLTRRSLCTKGFEIKSTIREQPISWRVDQDQLHITYDCYCKP
jgi:hypothetical protein